MTERRWLSWLGFVLALVSMVFVARQLFALRADLSVLLGNPRLLIVIAACALTYAVSLNLLGYGWAGLILKTRNNALDRQTLMGVFAATSLAKYLPGNVMHYAGRQWLASRYGATQARIAAASVGEVIATLAAGLSAAGGLWLWHIAPLPAGIIAAVIFVICLRFVRHPLIAMFTCALVFFVGNILMLLAMTLVVSANDDAFAMLACAYLLGWAAGNIVPGAPGGLGIRESAFIAVGTQLAIASPALIATLAVAMRLVSIAGDVGFYCFAPYWRYRTALTKSTRPL
ncbi:MAG: hypothetical protein AAF290_05445 [Pseudomonadota bacterium]